MKNSTGSFLVWAVDCNDEELKPSKSSIHFLKKRNVLPVSITSNFNEISHDQFAGYLKKIGFDNHLNPKLIVTDTFNRSDFVKSILSYSLEVGACAIALTSHGRKGLDRLIMGSFAEKLIEVSTLPILFLSADSFKASRKAVFATDFTIESEIAFRNFIRFCNGYIDELMIYHVDHSLVDTIAAYSASGVPAIFPSEFISDKSKEEDERRLKDWLNKYSKINPQIKIKTLIQDSIQTISKSILDVCKKEEVELLGMSTTSRPWERSFLGSVSRDVFRNGKIPVWLWGEFASEKVSNKFMLNRVGINQKSVLRAQKNHDA